MLRLPAPRGLFRRDQQVLGQTTWRRTCAATPSLLVRVITCCCLARYHTLFVLRVTTRRASARCGRRSRSSAGTISSTANRRRPARAGAIASLPALPVRRATETVEAAKKMRKQEESQAALMDDPTTNYWRSSKACGCFLSGPRAFRRLPAALNVCWTTMRARFLSFPAVPGFCLSVPASPGFF
jgi:hypothetical protein